ncbi:MAG: hypothetical protein J5689_02610 [Clostridia bacterium]|nr:hypothetical protein [Clostridia bacterium]
MEIVCVLIVVFSGLSGVFIASRYRERKAFFASLYNFLNYIKSNISFYKTRLEILIDNYDCETKFKNFLISVKNNLSSKVKNILPSYLTNQEKDEFVKFVSSLQNFDVSETIRSIDFYLSLVKNKVNQTGEEAKIKIPLIEKLTLGAGLIVAIILI